MFRWSEYPPPSRPVAMSPNGMVASAHPLASQAGLAILQAGGNAFDATVAVASTLGVVEPFMSGPGGIGVALVHVAGEHRTRVLNFSGRAPMGAELSEFTDDAKDVGARSPLVPGNVAGWLILHETYGSLEREILFRPAISYAENGFPMSRFGSRMFAVTQPRIARFPSSVSILLDGGGRPPAPSRLLKLPQLAASLRKIAAQGKDVFYRGELASKMAGAIQALGGLMTEDDLAGYQAEWQEPIRIGYRGYDILTVPPNSSGFQILHTMKLLEGFKDGDMAFQQPQALHLFMEAVKLCVTDRIKFAGDPRYVKAPLGGLLSDAYAAQQRLRINRETAATVSGEHYARARPGGALQPGRPEEFDGGMTTHFAVADRDGNVVSITQTLGGGFGSAVALGDTGIFLNNMCYWFDLEEGSPNLIGPGKQVDFVVAPTQTFRDGKLVLSMGTPGSWGILQTTPQMLVNVLDFGMSAQQAIDSPRFRYYEGRRVEMEDRFPLHLRRALEERGHEVDVIESWSWSVGGGQAIQIDHDQGVFHGGADPRRDGYALGW